MLDTEIAKRFGLETPIVNAGMAFVAGPELAAAVAQAGGLGMIGGAMLPPEGLRATIRATRARTSKCFGVDLIGDFIVDAHIDVLIEERVDVAVFFWTAPSVAQVARLKAAGVAFWMQIGTVEEAKSAAALGAEALIVQGAEAGGHNRAHAPLAQSFGEFRTAVPGAALIAAGGIADGATMAAALMLGAQAVWCGTRFLAAAEANAHDGYKARVVAARAGDTEITHVFGPEWPGQPVRALVNTAVRTARGRIDAALAQAAGQTIGTTVLGGEIVPVPKYSALLPTPKFAADLEWACLTAGTCAAEIDAVEPAGEIVARMTAEARSVLVEALRAPAA